jgi:pRiA4b ORF-3-like protein
VLAVAPVATTAVFVSLTPASGTDHALSVRGTPGHVKNGGVPRQVFQLRIALDAVSPEVWRRVLVPGGYTLDRVHRVFQHAMGWWDYHLHSFDINGIQYGEPDPLDELHLRDEMDTRLDAVAKVGDLFRYTYDYGDWWEHSVTVEAVWPADPDERYPVCLEGERACPPEDVGGVYGYRRFVRALHDPSDPEHDELRDWLGRGHDADYFVPELVTTLLRRMA